MEIDFNKSFKQAVKTMAKPWFNLTPLEIAGLNWPSRERYGIADKETGLLVHSEGCRFESCRLIVERCIK